MQWIMSLWLALPMLAFTRSNGTAAEATALHKTRVVMRMTNDS